MKRSLIANSAWNLVVGLSAAVVALVVPPVMSRWLSADVYGAWALALQIGAYVNIIGLSLQVAVGRFTGLAEASRDHALRDRVMATAFWALAAAAALGVGATVALAAALGHLLPDMTPPLRTDLARALPILGLSYGLTLPAMAFAGAFNGMQRSDISAKILVFGRLLTAAVLVAALLAGARSLVLLAMLHCALSAATGLMLFARWRRLVPGATIAPEAASRATARELAAFCGSLVVWNIAMLLIGGFDLLIVGHFDIAALPGFAAGTTLATFIAGALGALATPLVPATAALGTRSPSQVRALLARASRLLLAASILVTVPLVAGARPVLALWLGAGYGAAVPLAAGLLVVAFVRNLMLPYVTVAVGMARQHRILVTPLIEGGVCIAGALLLAPRWGAEGVVAAKLAAGFAGILLLLWQHPLGAAPPLLGRSQQFFGNILRPMLGALPPAAMVALIRLAGAWPAAEGAEILLCAAVVPVTMASLWGLTLRPEDKEFVMQFLRRRASRINNA
jgi:O-antigen/teichoic acid export membrane protein